MGVESSSASGLAPRIRVALALVVVALTGPPARADDAIVLGGYLELYGQYNLERPSNGVTNLRAFDTRHGTLALQNAVLSASWTKATIEGRIALQIGDAGNIYYAAEPVQEPTGSAPGTGPSAWRHVQEAWAKWNASRRLQLSAGLFLSPIGPESLATRDGWTWSRSNLFFALPFYHVGARAIAPLGDTDWTATAAVYNGWNSVIDGNRRPSVSISAAYAREPWSAQVLYFGGVERPAGSLDGEPWRHLIDAFVQARLGKLSVMAHTDAGIERGDAGTVRWLAAAGYARYELSRCVSVAARGDIVREWRGSRGGAQASAILLPVEWVASGTLALSYRPIDHLDLRLEYRHDHAADDAYFGGVVATEPATGAALPNRHAQDTVTAGAVAWF